MLTLKKLSGNNTALMSSVKSSDPGHFLKSPGKFFLSFPCTSFLHIMDEAQKVSWVAPFYTTIEYAIFK